MKRKNVIAGLWILALVVMFIFANSILNPAPEALYEPQENLQAPIEIPDVNVLSIEEANKLDKPVLALFYVDWCGYCRNFMPIFGEFAKKFKASYTFAAINCDKPEYKQLMEEFYIQGFPSVFVIDNKINHKFPLNNAAIGSAEVMEKELNNYLDVRKKLLK